MPSGRGQIPREIEDISREEMRHFKWLFEKIVELGGIPTLERAEILKGETLRQMLENDVIAEDIAIEKCRRDIGEIGVAGCEALSRRRQSYRLVSEGARSVTE